MRFLLILLVIISCSEEPTGSIITHECTKSDVFKISDDVFVVTVIGDGVIDNNVYIKKTDYSDCEIVKNKKICNKKIISWAVSFRYSKDGIVAESEKIFETQKLGESSFLVRFKTPVYGDVQSYSHIPKLVQIVPREGIFTRVDCVMTYNY